MAQKPTRQMRHIDIREMIIIQWVEENHIMFKGIKLQFNIINLLSKATPASKFYEHTDIMMGHFKLHYAPENPHNNNTTYHNKNDQQK